MVRHAAVRAFTVLALALALLASGAAFVDPETKGVMSALAAKEASAQGVGGKCAEAAKVAWANRWNPWPPRYVVMAFGMAASCGYWIGGLWSNRAMEAANDCWPNCPWWAPFRFW